MWLLLHIAIKVYLSILVKGDPGYWVINGFRSQFVGYAAPTYILLLPYWLIYNLHFPVIVSQSKTKPPYHYIFQSLATAFN